MKVYDYHAAPLPADLDCTDEDTPVRCVERYVQAKQVTERGLISLAAVKNRLLNIEDGLCLDAPEWAVRESFRLSRTQ